MICALATILLILPQNAIATFTLSSDRAGDIHSPTGGLSATHAAIAPTGFTEKKIGSIDGSSGNPSSGTATGLALSADGKLFVGTKEGVVSVYSESIATTSLLNANALTLGDVCSDFERGMQSLALDPAYATNKYVYLYYTYNGSSGTNNCAEGGTVTNIVNRVVRYTFNDATSTLTSPQVILDKIPSRCGNHNGGAIQFGADGFMYVSTGDSGGCWLPGGSTTSSRYKSLLSGKILRINKDGSVPSANPFASEAGSVKCSDSDANYQGGTCQETFAWGFRNPFRMTFKSGTNQLYVNDVGQNLYEEIDNVTAGNDYGWNCREGFHPYASLSSLCPSDTSSMIDPLYEYNHQNGCAITGAAFVVSNGIWPAAYEGAYLFGDYCQNNVFQLIPGSPYSRQDFLTQTSGAAITLLWDTRNAALYYLLNSGNTSSVWRVTYSASTVNHPPVAVATASPTSGAAPLAVSFNGAGSSDPDGDPLTYGWTFGDGGTSSAQNPAHTYTTSGTFNATLIVTDSKGAPSQPATVTIRPGTTPPVPPVAQITSPAASTRFSVGQVFTLSGSASDARDGDISSQIAWNVVLVHVPQSMPNNTHTHPFYQGTGRTLQLPPMPLPEDSDAAPQSYISITLTVKNSQGLTTVITQALQPQRATLTFSTQPAGLSFDVNAVAVSTTQVINVWQGQQIPVAAPAFQQALGKNYLFGNWSDHGTAAHTITAPGTSTTYLATFSETTNTPPVAKITTPVSSTQVTVGQVITLSGTATDTQDGDLSNRIVWQADIVRPALAAQSADGLAPEAVSAPFFTGTGNSVTLPPIPSPADLGLAESGYVRIQLTVTDSQNLPTVVTLLLQPKRTQLTFNTQPDGLRLDTLGTSITAAKTINVWQGQALQVSAPGLQLASDGKYYKFGSWADGGSATRTIIANDKPITYTVTFTAVSTGDVKKIYAPLIAR